MSDLKIGDKLQSHHLIANCGCVHAAEDEVACEHDVELNNASLQCDMCGKPNPINTFEGIDMCGPCMAEYQELYVPSITIRNYRNEFGNQRNITA